MKRYTFVVNPQITLLFEVEAASLAEALAKAGGAPVMSLCHQCARGEQGAWRTSGELDADPTYAELVDAQEDGEDVTEAARVLWFGHE
jgi:hypothetical protein